MPENKKLFSQRKKLTPVNELLQINSFDDFTQRRLWDLFNPIFEIHYYHPKRKDGNNIQVFVKLFYTKILKKALFEMPPIFIYDYDTYGSANVNIDISNIIKEYWSSATYYTQLDIIEIFVQSFPRKEKEVNDIFEELSIGYKVVNGNITDLLNEEEIKSLNKASKASIHIQKATKYLYDRKNKDYENSIKESVSAVEEMCHKITGKENDKLSKCIKELKTKKIYHPAFLDTLDKMYAYASDEGGIRHANKQKGGKVDQSEARLILLVCSATVNFLQEKINRKK